MKIPRLHLFKRYKQRRKFTPSNMYKTWKKNFTHGTLLSVWQFISSH